MDLILGNNGDVYSIDGGDRLLMNGDPKLCMSNKDICCSLDCAHLNRHGEPSDLVMSCSGLLIRIRMKGVANG